ncbi:DUF72 domain-containing protein [Microvirga rosea]|uniref:DUF72 domain-containing protein n=1 Tax=Microvirga rosea TaxID=2715425 RepID=UPI001D09A369|nr:DUF72 domain-containing protein [Microvirga rosea]MCB8819709.1 DUF72 domain-containing protein [Microvirga rosea]
MSKPRGPAALEISSLTPPPRQDFGAADLRIGTSGWHYRSWNGPFYPSDLKPKDFLSFYVEYFNTAEINNSFYRLPTEQAVSAWAKAVPEGFLFAWKVSRYITHLKRLKDVEESIDLVFGRMDLLGATQGPALFQLPPSFKADAANLERLNRCLARVPDRLRCAVEFRHPSWYDERSLDLLRSHNAALCLSDHRAAPAPWVATADFVYVRGHGPTGFYAGSYEAGTLKEWAGMLRRWRNEKRDVFVYFDNDIKGAAPGDARQLLTLTGA